MIIDWDIKEIKSEVDKIRFAANDPKMDGFTTWGAKKDLYKIYWYVEDALSQCSTYDGEDKFTKKRKHNKLIQIIKESDTR
jgi:hypothetical protein